jgi:hypothetical protein
LPPLHGAPGPRAWWQGLPLRRRRLLRALFAPALIVILAGGVLLARYLSVENAERDDVLALVQAEVKGYGAAMLHQLNGCRYPWLSSPAKRVAAKRACVAGVEADAANPRLRRTGAVKILQLEVKSHRSSFGGTGETRVAWTVIGGTAAEGGGLPVVQCVAVRRTGNLLAGAHVQLLALSRTISGEGQCTKETQLEREEEEATAVEEGK